MKGLGTTHEIFCPVCRGLEDPRTTECPHPWYRDGDACNDKGIDISARVGLDADGPAGPACRGTPIAH